MLDSWVTLYVFLWAIIHKNCQKKIYVFIYLVLDYIIGILKFSNWPVFK